MAEKSTANKSSKLTFKEIYSQSLGMVIGAGIITSTGFAIGFTGTGVWLAYILAGIAFLIMTLPSIIGGSVVPRTSGNYFMACQIHTAAGGFYSLLFFFTCVSIGFMGMSFASYVGSLTGFGSTRFWGIGILTLFFLVNLLDQKSVVKIQTIQNIALVLAWGSFILFGINKINWSVVFNTESMFPNGFSGMFESVAMLVFAMGGGFWLIDSGERIENPKKNVFLGNIAATGSAMLLFAVVSMVASGILPVSEVANQPLTLVAQQIYPGNVYLLFIFGGALIALCTTINARFMAAANALVRSTQEGWFPKALAKQNKNGVPIYFLAIVYLITILPIALGIDTALLNKVSAASSQITFLVPNIGFLFLVKKFPEEWKNSKWHMPNWALACLTVICNGLLLVIVAKNVSAYTPFLFALFGGLILVFIIYAVWRAPYAQKIIDERKAHGIQ